MNQLVCLRSALAWTLVLHVCSLAAEQPRLWVSGASSASQRPLQYDCVGDVMFRSSFFGVSSLPSAFYELGLTPTGQVN